MKTIITPEKKREYYLNFKKSHADQIKEKVICTKCSGSYDYYNKSKHEKTRKHLMHDELQLLKNNYLILKNT